MAFANATIKTTNNNAPNTAPLGPVAAVNKPAEQPAKTAAIAKVSAKKTIKQRFSFKNVHRYKLVLSGIIGCIAALTSYSIHNSRYVYELQSYYAVSEYESVDLAAMARNRILTEKDKVILANKYEQAFIDVDIQAVRLELAELDGINYEQWSDVLAKIDNRVTAVKNNRTAAFIKENNLSDLHIEQINAVRASDDFAIPQPNDQQALALKGVTMLKVGKREAMSTAYVDFKVAAELGDWAAQKIADELERLLPPEQIAEVRFQLEDALLAAGITPEPTEEELKAAAEPEPTEEEEEEKELTEEEQAALEQEKLKEAAALAAAKAAEAKERNVQREADVQTLANAIHQRVIDNDYVIPASLQGLETGKELCATTFALCNGAKAIVEELLSGKDSTTYMPAIPVDSLSKDKGYSGYKITVSGQTLTITSLYYENGKYSKTIDMVAPEPEVTPATQESSESSYFRVNKRAIRENFDWYQKRFE